MSEDFLHYIWRSALFFPLSTDDFKGEKIDVINTGELNLNSGPDFFNAVIRIGNMIFAGNVEVHINASDWYRHGHHQDKAYDSVILQVVLKNDAVIRRTSGEIIPTVTIRFDERLISNYRHLLMNNSWIPCQAHINETDYSLINEWLGGLAINRLKQKSKLIKEIFYYSLNSWEETFYRQLARNFGFRLNGGAFELLAKGLPYRILLRHRDSLFQLEAILFGQAGLLNGNSGDHYFNSLKNEYIFLKGKYDLKPMEKHLWRYLRLRPANFPTVRIAQFAAFLHVTPSLFSLIIEATEYRYIEKFFRVSASDYWDTHYLFNKKSSHIKKKLGVTAVRSIIINTVVPLLYFYGRARGINECCTRAEYFLKGMPAENNSIINNWKSIGVPVYNAFLSQALLQQKNEYCKFRRCLECEIGNNIIKRL